jgi:4-diphosphocytidyl-2-C-methyl-D-erythritol kinase
VDLTWYPAPAKLNLFLHVLGKRPDGYHELQTVFRLIDCSDRVGIGQRSDGKIVFDGAFGEANLVVRAARLLKAEIGADVPFFVYGRNAVGEGIGERLAALELPSAWYLVLTPQVSVSTKEIFESALTRGTKRLKIPPFLSGQGANDLEAAVVARFPDVAAHLAWLRKHRPQARMTGSGACLFAEFETEAEARALYAALPAGMGGFVARGLERHPILDLKIF